MCSYVLLTHKPLRCREGTTSPRAANPHSGHGTFTGILLEEIGEEGTAPRQDGRGHGACSVPAGLLPQLAGLSLPGYRGSQTPASPLAFTGGQRGDFAATLKTSRRENNALLTAAGRRQPRYERPRGTRGSRLVAEGTRTPRSFSENSQPSEKRRLCHEHPGAPPSCVGALREQDTFPPLRSLSRSRRTQFPSVNHRFKPKCGQQKRILLKFHRYNHSATGKNETR